MKKIVLAGAIMLLSGLSFYAWLGGFQEPKIVETQVPGYILAGKEFKGKADDQQLGQLFDEIKSKNKSGQLPGTPMAIYYQTTKDEEGSIDAFIGVWVKDSSLVLPKKFRFIYIKPDNAIQAHITTHFLVAPAPEKVETHMKNFASQHGLLLKKMLIERYVSASSIVLEIPVQAKAKSK